MFAWKTVMPFSRARVGSRAGSQSKTTGSVLSGMGSGVTRRPSRSPGVTSGRDVDVEGECVGVYQ